MTINYNGKEYPMNTTMRLAYKLQGENGHTPYLDVISNIGDKPVEEQVAVLYTSFVLANPDEAKFISKKDFLDYYLDNVTIMDMMTQIKEVISLMMGKNIDELTEGKDKDKSGN